MYKQTFRKSLWLLTAALLARGGLWMLGLVAALGMAIIYPRRKQK